MEASPLVQIIAQIINTRRSEVHISPAWVATEALIALKAARLQKWRPLVYLAAHLELRQIARQQLREKFEPEEDADKEIHPLFPELQWRYPVEHKRGEEPQYVLLESLGRANAMFNVGRLRADANSRLKHADALEAWADAYFPEEGAA